MPVDADLQRSPFQDARQLAHRSPGMAHEEALQRRDLIDGGQSNITRRTDGTDIVGEQTIESVGHREEHHGVKAPPRLVAGQDVGIADVEAETGGIDHDLCEGGNVPESKIEALSGDGMHAMGRVTHYGQSMTDVRLGIVQRKRIAPAGPDGLDVSKEIAESLPHLPVEVDSSSSINLSAMADGSVRQGTRGCPSAAEWQMDRR